MQAMQCPKCGGALGFAPQATRAVCGYCGGSVRISRDASGQPVAVLEDIRTSADILAAEVARKRLEERLADLRESYSQFYERYTNARDEANRLSWTAAIGGIVLGFVLGSIIGEWTLPLLIVGSAIGLVLALRARTARLAEVGEAYESVLNQIIEELGEVTTQLRAVTAKMDGLVMQM